MSDGQEECFLIQALRLDSIAEIFSNEIFGYVVSLPIACPGCGEPWALVLNKPLSLEVELGYKGRRHLELLKAAMQLSCKAKDGSFLFQTDGQQVWQLQSQATALDS